MLVLTRKKDEGVVLSNSKTGEVYGRVVVCKSHDDRLKLGFICVDHLQVTRDEIALDGMMTEEEFNKFQTPRLIGRLEGGERC